MTTIFHNLPTVTEPQVLVSMDDPISDVSEVAAVAKKETLSYDPSLFDLARSIADRAYYRRRYRRSYSAGIL